MGSPWSIAYSLNLLGTAAYAQGAYAEAQQLLHEGLALSQNLADRYNTASAKSSLGMVHQALGDGREARRCFKESIAIWREIGELGGLAQTLNRYGQSLIAQADGPMARRCFLETLDVARHAQITPIVLDGLLGVAALQAQEGNVESALELVLHILQDPAHTQGIHNRADQLRTDLEADLTAQQIDVIRTRVQDRTLDALVQDLLNAL
jgi:tetratricopeptide (TPR) repeat protein